MKKINLCYIVIIFILIFNNYLYRIFRTKNNIVTDSLLENLEKVNIILLFLVTIFLFVFKERYSFSYIKTTFILILLTIFLKNIIFHFCNYYFKFYRKEKKIKIFILYIYLFLCYSANFK